MAVNDFIVVVVGGITYTLGVSAIASDTSLTLISAYDGPAATGAAWSAVPNQTLVGVTAQLAAEASKAIRAYNNDKVNWTQIFSASGNVTTTTPDGNIWTGPAWNNALSKSNYLSEFNTTAAKA